MFTKKYLLLALFIAFTGSSSLVQADDISDMKAVLTDTIAKLVQRYEARITELETENMKLKQELASVRGTGAVAGNTGTTVQKPVAIPATTTSAMTKTETYNAVMKRANERLGSILSENNLPGYTAIGLFEFIEPNVFFISLDDGNNPAGITAFKTKILYTFDDTLTLTKIGFFDLDYASQKYRTMFGSNPYAKSVRTRIQNPNYKGKLLEGTGSNSGSLANISTTSTVTTEATFAQIKMAYDKTKLLDALRLSDVYIVKNPNDIEVLRIRYRSYYIVGKYEESLAEIKKMETLQ